MNEPLPPVPTEDVAPPPLPTELAVALPPEPETLPLLPTEEEVGPVVLDELALEDDELAVSGDPPTPVPPTPP